VSLSGRAAVATFEAERLSSAPSADDRDAEDERPSRADAALKRAIDLVGAVCLLVLLFPLLATVAVAIVLSSGRPVFHRCRRIGRHGHELRMLKFRKMRQDATGPRLTVANDPRFTRVGRLLARTKIDELPQLWHVLKGEMSLVGPRPEDPHYVAHYADAYDEILRVKPGITGLTQLAFAEEARVLGSGDPNGAYLNRLLPQKVKLDRLYATRRSNSMDLKILWWTLIAVVLRRQVSVHRTTGGLSRRRRAEVSATAGPMLRGSDA
jgi:lipopolysaccharide/colanic/teichoic acid biosynthesis glycosyltransferase